MGKIESVIFDWGGVLIDDPAPGRAVFIDDAPQYTDAARDAGLNTILFKSIDQVRNELARLGV